MSFVFLLVYWWEQGVPFIEYVWGISNWEFYLDFQTIANWQLVPHLHFGKNVWQPAIGNLIRICNQQSGILSGFWAIGSWGTLSKNVPKKDP